MSKDAVLIDVIISYPNLFVAKQINGKGDPKFSATLILPANFDWNTVMPQIQEAITAKFGANVPANLKMPWQDATADGFPGQFLCKTYGDRQPGVVDQGTQPIMDQGLIFAGCKVNAYVGFYAYDNNGGGVGVGINGVQIVDNSANMPRLDNSKSMSEVFQPIAGAPTATAPQPGGYPQPGAPVQGAPQQGYPQPGAPVQGAPQQGYPQPGAPVQGAQVQGAPQPGAPGAQPWNQ